jgi:hypothetical protein
MAHAKHCSTGMEDTSKDPISGVEQSSEFGDQKVSKFSLDEMTTRITQLENDKNEILMQIPQLKNEMSTRITQLENDKNEMLMQISQLKNEMSSQIKNLKTEIDLSLKGNVSQLKREMTDETSAIIALMNNESSLSKKEMKNEIIQLEIKFEELENKFEKLENKFEKLENKFKIEEDINMERYLEEIDINNKLTEEIDRIKNIITAITAISVKTPVVRNSAGHSNEHSAGHSNEHSAGHSDRHLDRNLDRNPDKHSDIYLYRSPTSLVRFNSLFKNFGRLGQYMLNTSQLTDLRNMIIGEDPDLSIKIIYIIDRALFHLSTYKFKMMRIDNSNEMFWKQDTTRVIRMLFNILNKNRSGYVFHVKRNIDQFLNSGDLDWINPTHELSGDVSLGYYDKEREVIYQIYKHIYNRLDELADSNRINLEYTLVSDDN